MHIVRIEDHEGTGTCGNCQREGLRWIVVIGEDAREVAHVGAECAKKVLGYALARPGSYKWVSDYALTEQYDGDAAHGVTYTLWTRKDGNAAVIARNGYAILSGSLSAVQRDWTTRYAA